MHVKSIDLKRCLGNPDMDNRTAIRRLVDLGFSPDIKYIVTEELIEKVNHESKANMLSHERYSPKSSYSRKL